MPSVALLENLDAVVNINVPKSHTLRQPNLPLEVNRFPECAGSSILNLKGAVVTADAMPCQMQTAQKSIDNEADYGFAVERSRWDFPL